MISPDTRARCLRAAEPSQGHFAVQAGADEKLVVGNEEKTSLELGNLPTGEGSLPVYLTNYPLQ